jgi:DNA segregation ATPase FtsK/SpoIIIE-like protein
MVCAARSFSGVALRGFGAVLLTAIVCTWAGTLNLAPDELACGAYPAGPGGLVGGQYLAPPLREYFGPVGIYLVLVAAGVLASLMVAQEVTEPALAFVGREFLRVLQAGWATLIGRLRPVPAVPALVTAGARPDGASPGAPKNDRLALNEPSALTTRRLRGLLDEPAGTRPPGASRLPKRTDRVASGDEAPTEAEESEEAVRLRHEEAVRQAEAAEVGRLQREKEQREHHLREARALEKLERERVGQERERDKARARFMAVVSAQEAVPDAGAAPARPVRRPEDYKLPDPMFLEAKDEAKEVASEVLKERGIKLIETLWEFKIGSRLVSIVHGPAVTMYELLLDPGIKVQRVIGLSDNLAMAMKSEFGVRVIAPLPGRDTIGIEIPNTEEYVVRMRPILESPQFRSGNWTLPLVLGRDTTGNPLVADLAKMPHLLIAGTTGSGKSVCLNAIILSLLLMRRPDEVKMILVDPKQVEMTDFKGIPHLLSPVVMDMKLAAGVLTWAVQKMEERYDRMSKVGVRNISTFNRLSRQERLARLPEGEPPEAYLDPMPYVVVIVDEFADLMLSSGKEIEQAMTRLAHKARAAGVHVILATQRPSADVVTGLIKTNLPCRICFQVKSKIDSRIVLDYGGAEKLAGKGDMLLVPPGSSQFIRAKGVFVADHEVKKVVEFCKGQAEPEYSDEVERVASQAAQGEADGAGGPESLPMDEKFEEAVECFLACGRASTSLLQRRMGLGYTRAAKICDQMEALGIVGPDRGAKGRELLISLEGWEAYRHGKLAELSKGPRPPRAGADAPSADSPVPPAAAFLDNVDGTREGARSPGEEDEDNPSAPAPALVGEQDSRGPGA